MKHENGKEILWVFIASAIIYMFRNNLANSFFTGNKDSLAVAPVQWVFYGVHEIKIS